MRNKCGTKFYLEFYSFRGYIESYYAQMSLCTVFESRGRHFSANYIGSKLILNFKILTFFIYIYRYGTRMSIKAFSFIALFLIIQFISKPF